MGIKGLRSDENQKFVFLPVNLSRLNKLKQSVQLSVWLTQAAK